MSEFDVGSFNWGYEFETSWDANDNGSWKKSIPECYQIRKKCTKHPDSIHIENVMFEANARIYFSCIESWEAFLSTNPSVVAIDCEGTSGSNSFPLLIQIATYEHVILEFPYEDETDGPKLSSYLESILQNPNVLKIFCDPTGNDETMLHCICNNKLDLYTLFVLQNSHLTKKDQNKAKNMGLIDYINYSVKGLYRYEKDSIKANGWHQMKTSASMKRNQPFLNYAAADAWGTLFAYLNMIDSPVVKNQMIDGGRKQDCGDKERSSDHHISVVGVDHNEVIQNQPIQHQIYSNRKRLNKKKNNQMK
jgi:hypothetical protein